MGHDFARSGHGAASRGIYLSTFDALKIFVDKDESKTLLSYEQAAKLLGVRAGAAKTLVHRFRKRYSAIVRQQIARTVSDPAEVDEEIQREMSELPASENAGSKLPRQR